MFERLPKVRRFDEALDHVDASDARSTARRFTVGAADDRSEQRADQVADRGLDVLTRARSATQSTLAIAPAESGRIRRSHSPVVAGQVGLDGGTVDGSDASLLSRALIGGRPFEPGVRRDVRRAIGYDVGNARIHTDSRADRLARSMQANAFTVDSHVFFAGGQYRPDTTDGMRTLLHESAHLAEDGGRVRRSVIRRQLSVGVDDLDGSFKHHTGVKGLAASLGGSEITKIRDGLKRYHAARPGDPKQLDALQSLLKYADIWLRKHPKPKDRAERSRIDLIDSIRTQAGLEYAKAQASNIYMGDAAASPVLGGARSAAGPGSHPLQHLKQGSGFAPGSFAKRADPNNFGGGSAARARTKHGLAAPDAATEAALTDALASLSPAEYAAIATYSEADYSYINPAIAGRTGKQGNENLVEEAGLHAGFIGEAWAKLPVWKGTSYRGQAMPRDFLGFTSKGSLKINEYWSSTEARTVGLNFIRDYNDGATIAALFTINVTNGRDISRLSSSGGELEILLPPGSKYAVAQKRCLRRGTDDDEIRRHFGDDIFDKKHLTEFWLVSLAQSYSGDNDASGRYQSSHDWSQASASKTGNRWGSTPWAGFSPERILRS